MTTGCAYDSPQSSRKEIDGIDLSHPEPLPPPPPKNNHRATFLHIVGPSDRPLTCSAFEVETGAWELRLAYGDDVGSSRPWYPRSPIAPSRPIPETGVWLLMACDNTEIVQEALGHTSENTMSIDTTMAVDRRLAEANKKAFGG